MLRIFLPRRGATGGAAIMAMACGILTAGTAAAQETKRETKQETKAAVKASAPASFSVVELRKTAQGFALFRNGWPYFIKGGGGHHYLETLKAAGGNSIRTWGEDDLEPLLDRAQQLGLSVTIGIWLGQERQGFNYSDAAQVKGELEKTRRFIRRYRSHPALLMWGLGNEMEGSGENPIIWRTVNDIAKMVKEEDPHHPTMTVIAEIGANGTKAKHFMESCPDVDILGINSYAGLASLPKRLKEVNFNRPYVVTEYGPAGPWEVRKTAWNAPIEPSSTQKAATYLANYQSAVSSQVGRCLGSYAFLWGDKIEATPTWFGMLLPSGERLGTVDAVTYAWSGQWPANRAPVLTQLEMSAKDQTLTPGAAFTADATAADPDGDALMTRWEVRSEISDRKTGGDPEAPPFAHPEAFIESKGLHGQFRAPEIPGAYRLFVYIYDGKGHAATANIPFLVRNG